MDGNRLRVGDAERDQVASGLHEHFAQGRLDREELDERLTAALSAKTVGDLRKITEDLPGPAGAPPSPVAAGGREPGARHPRWGGPSRTTGREPYGGGPWAWHPGARRVAYRGRHPRFGPRVGLFIVVLGLVAAFGGGWGVFPLFALLWGAMALHGIRRVRRWNRSAG